MYQLLPGKLNIQLISGNVSDLLSKLNGAGISVYNLKSVDEITVQCNIRQQDYRNAAKLSSQLGAQVIIRSESGLSQYIRRTLNRWVLLVGTIMLLLLTIYIPDYVLFIQVKGNATIPTQLIIEKAEECGIYWGASRRELRSEQVKNALISSLPELQWVGVNTYGCVAEISVKEKTLPDEDSAKSEIASIVAATDGIIRDLTVIRGNALCRVGEAVKAGQVIISGYTNCGLLLIGKQAEGEIYADTRRSITSISPLVCQRREDISNKKTNFSLQIGKNLINFYNDSGISDASCVKMYKKRCLTLPGGFQLPIALITETISYHTLNDVCTEKPEDFDWLSAEAKSYLLKQTVAGKLLKLDEARVLENGVCTITGSYSCYEMIGRIQKEESAFKHGSND